MIVKMRNRDDNADFSALDLDFDVDRYSWAAIGGPKDAKIEVKGSDKELWRLINRVRYPVRIYSNNGDAVWWGFISDIEATILNPDVPKYGRVQVGVSVDTCYNKIAIAYTQVDITTGEETRATTDWAEDTISQDAYGIRELLKTHSAATQTHAEAARDKELNDKKYPIPIITAAPEATESGAVINCRGWWSTLGWRYYANAGTASVDTAAQGTAIFGTKGEYFNNIFKDVTSGISIRETRDGDSTALYEALQMLEMGTTNYRRMLVTIDERRNVRIYEEPAIPAIPYKILSDGSLESNYGQILRKELCTVAVWAKMKDAIPASFNSTLLADPSLIFIEENEYDAKNDKLTPIGRGNLDPWEFPIVKDG